MSAAIIPNIALSREEHIPVWQPKEERIYCHFYFYVKSLGIKPVRFERWVRLSDGKDFYEDE